MVCIAFILLLLTEFFSSSYRIQQFLNKFIVGMAGKAHFKDGQSKFPICVHYNS